MDLHAVCCSLFLLTCTGVSFGQQLLLPESIDIKVGENLVITPISIPDSRVFARWSFNGTIFITEAAEVVILPPYTDRASLNTTTLALTLRSLTESDTGIYALAVVTVTAATSVTLVQVLAKWTGDEGGDSLSAGAIAGIVIGVIVGVAAIAGLIYYFVTKNTPETSSRENKHSGANVGQHELHYADIRHNQRHQGTNAMSNDPTLSPVSPQSNIQPASNSGTQTIYSNMRNVK